jgi:hypothetical protein
MIDRGGAETRRRENENMPVILCRLCDLCVRKTFYDYINNIANAFNVDTGLSQACKRLRSFSHEATRYTGRLVVFINKCVLSIYLCELCVLCGKEVNVSGSSG